MREITNEEITELDKEAITLVRAFLTEYPDTKIENVLDLVRGCDIPVFVDRNNDLDYFMYSVVILGTDYWLDAFDYEAEADAFIIVNNLYTLEDRENEHTNS